MNDPEAIRRAFTKYDSGAQIEDIQYLNIVYDMKDNLDAQGIYGSNDIDAFKGARFETIRKFGKDEDTDHKAMFAATQAPTDMFNRRLKTLREAAHHAEESYQQASALKNDDAMKKADHEREQVEDAIGQLTDLKAGLSRFSRTYTYIAQLVDLGDPELENFCAFTKLLANRLDGVPPEQVDLKGIALFGYHIRVNDDQGTSSGDDVPGDQPLKPLGPGGSPMPGATPIYLLELIERLNGIFGEAAPIKDRASFVK